MSESLAFQNFKNFDDRVDGSRDAAGSESEDLAKIADACKTNELQALVTQTILPVWKAGIEFPSFKKAFPASQNTNHLDDRVDRSRDTAGSDSWVVTKIIVGRQIC